MKQIGSWMIFQRERINKMTELQLYKFIRNIEYHIYCDGEEKEDLNGWEENDLKKWEVFIFPSIQRLNEFCELMGNSFEEYGLNVLLKRSYAVIDLIPFAENFDIDLKEVLR